MSNEQGRGNSGKKNFSLSWHVEETLRMRLEREHILIWVTVDSDL